MIKWYTIPGSVNLKNDGTKLLSISLIKNWKVLVLWLSSKDYWVIAIPLSITWKMILDILLNNEICKTYFLVIYASKNLLILTLSTWSIWGRGGGTEESCWNVWKARFLVNLIISSSTWAILSLSSIGSFPVDLCKNTYFWLCYKNNKQK